MTAPVVGLRSLFRDPLVRASLVVFGLASLVLVLARIKVASQPLPLVGLLDTILAALALIALFRERTRQTGTARRFWTLLAGSWGCLVLVDAVFYLDFELPLVDSSLVIDGLHVLFYLLLALAIDLRPHLAEIFSLSRARRRVESAAGVMVVFGLLIYFALVVQPEPLGLSLSFVPRADGLTPFLLVRLSLDVLILGRLLYVRIRAESTWRPVYSLLAGGLFCIGVKDALGVALSEQVVSLESLGLWYQVFLYLPALLFIMAARFDLGAPDDIGRNQSGDAGPSESEPVATSPLALYALIVPAMHFLFYSLDVLDAASRVPREIFCLGYMMALGATAMVHEALLTKDNLRATAALLDAEARLVRSQRLEAIGRLAGGIAHDFNNYLTVIQGYSELIDGSVDDANVREDVSFIRDAAEKASNLTSQLLAFGRRQQLDAQPLDLNEVVTSTGRILESLLGEDVELEFELDPELGLVMADLGQTEQVVVNLALNARDAMPNGGRLSIATRPVLVDPTRAEDLNIEPGVYAELGVTDTGSGMTDEVRARVFEPFFTSKDLGQGTGLGLATVYGIVNQSGGTIEVDTFVGQGTTMRVLLPGAELPIELESIPNAGQKPERREATVLLVEDAAPVRALAERSFAKSGYRVFAASNGKEALELFSVWGEEIDLVVTDVMMPEMDGIELSELLRASVPNLPILFISGYPRATLRERRGGLPSSELLLHKPFTPSSLLDRVNDLLASE